MKNKSLSTVKSPIARKFIIWIVLFSSLITLLTTSIQIYHDYKADLNIIQSNIKQIKNVYLDSMNISLWTLNNNVLQANVDGILETRDIEFVNVIDDEYNVVASSGKKPEKNYIQHDFTMHYLLNDNKINIGQLTVFVTLDGVYQRLIDTVLVILVSNGVKTFLVAIFIYYLFQHLVGRHISKITDFAENLDHDSMNDAFIYDRKIHGPSKHDEFDSLKKSLLNMLNKLKESKNLILQREGDLSITLNSIGDAVIATDIKGYVTRMNPVAEMLTGWDFNEAHGKLITEIYPIITTNTREPLSNPINKVIESDRTVHIYEHTTLISKDGTEYKITESASPIRRNGDAIGMVLVFNDVTEQYQLRETATKYKEYLEAIMDYSPALIYIKDVEGKYLLVNPQYEKQLHIQHKKVIGKTDHDIFSKKIADEFLNNDKRVIAAGKFFEYEETLPYKNEVKIYHSIKFPLCDKKNNIYAVCGISTDVTEKKAKDEQLRRSQKMDALGKLTGGIAHDYNNALGVILGYSDLLQEKLEDSPKLVKYVNQIQNAGNRSVKLTKKLLAFSKTDTSASTSVNINTLLLEEKDMLKKTLTVRIKLLLELDEGLWLTFLDINELEDVILNMGINALHAMKDVQSGAQLTIKTCNQVINPANAGAMGIHPGEYVQLSISDTGCGMEHSIIEKIYEPFYTTKGEMGSGLGLSQVFGFVRRTNGAIEVYSEPGHGTQFILYFPRYLGDDSIKSTEPTKNNDNFSGKESILIVDDEEALGALSSTILSEQGYHITYASSGESALKILESEPIDMVVSDVLMPEMDGYQLASAIRKKYPLIKIQLISGFSDNSRLEVDKKLLHENLLQKPYSAEELLRTVRNLFNSEQYN